MDVLWGTFKLRRRAWLLIWHSGVQVKSLLVWGLFIEGINKLSELLINFFQRLDGMLELEEGVFKATGQ